MDRHLLCSSRAGVIVLAVAAAACEAGTREAADRAQPPAAADTFDFRPPAYNPDEPHPPGGQGPVIEIDTLPAAPANRDP
jgi:hypothetical protein